MLNINAALLPAKGHYFAFFAGLGALLPFGGTVASQFGASPALVGTIYLTLQFCQLVAKPVFGFLADKLQQKKPIFLCSTLLGTAALFAICFIPPVDEAMTSISLLCQNQTLSMEVCGPKSHDGEHPWPATCNVTCHHHGFCIDDPSQYQSNQSQNSSAPPTTSFLAQTDVSLRPSSSSEGCSEHVIKSLQDLPVCANSTHIPCNISCDGAPEPNAYEINHQIAYFWILMITGHVFAGTVVSMGDTLVLDMLPDKAFYGRQRLYGSMGYGLVAIISGQLVDTFSDGESKRSNFTPAYCILLILGLADFMIASRMNEKKVEKPKHLLSHVVSLFKDAETMLVTVAVFLVGFFSGILWTFLNVYLVSLEASVLLIGLAFGVQCFLGEMPFMFISKWFLKRIGHAHSMTLVLAVFGIRFLLYYLIDNPWFVLPIDTTQGICFGVFFTAVATYSSVIAPPSSQATVQGILQGIFEGLGAGTGAFFGGLVYQSLGGKMMWLVMGGASCGLSILYGLILVAIQARKKKISTGVKNDIANGDAELKATEIIDMLRVQPVSEQHSVN